jgi:hypothetical protein
MASEIAEFVEILVYLLLTIFGGVVLAMLAILLIMLIAALGRLAGAPNRCLEEAERRAGSTARF